jgi:hypothetical protein
MSNTVTQVVTFNYLYFLNYDRCIHVIVSITSCVRVCVYVSRTTVDYC